jgi:hypothetical protein
MTTRTIEPTKITRGERIAWTRSFSGYSAEDYDLQYRFRGPGPGADVDADADGSGFDAELTAAESTLMVAGDYTWQAWLTEQATPTNTFLAASGRTKVLAGFVAGNTGDVDMRTTAKIMLDTIDAALLAFATSDVTEYEITTPAGSRSVKRSDKSELMSQRKYWAGIVTNEIAREGASNGRPLMSSVKMVVYDA